MKWNNKSLQRILFGVVLSGMVLLSFSFTAKKIRYQKAAKDTLQFLGQNDEYSSFSTNLFLTK